MHSDPSTHLHSEECNIISAAYFQCLNERKFAKFLGVCDDLNEKLRKCFKKERLARAEANHVKARASQAETRRRMAEANRRRAEKERAEKEKEQT